MVKCTYRGHRRRHCLLYAEGIGNQPGVGGGRLGTDNQTDMVHTGEHTGALSYTEGTDNQTDRGYTPLGTLGHCQLYIQKA